MNNPIIITLRAAAATDLSAATNRGLGVAQDADGLLVLAGVDGSDIIGILAELPRAAGGPCGVAIAGTVRAKAGAAINEGDFCTSEAGGGIIAAAADDQIIGQCIQRGGVADLDMFDLLIAKAMGPTAAAP